MMSVIPGEIICGEEIPQPPHPFYGSGRMSAKGINGVIIEESSGGYRAMSHSEQHITAPRSRILCLKKMPAFSPE